MSIFINIYNLKARASAAISSDPKAMIIKSTTASHIRRTEKCIHVINEIFNDGLEQKKEENGTYTDNQTQYMQNDHTAIISYT